MIGELFKPLANKEIFQPLADMAFIVVDALAFNNRKRITFSTYNPKPYDLILYLEKYGVKVWITSKIQLHEDGEIVGLIKVTPGQYNYACGLIAGMDGFSLVGVDAKPITPKRSWGKPSRVSGINESLLRFLGG